MSLPPGFLRVDAFSAFPAMMRGGVVAIGNFDGVHRGHQLVLEKALELALKLGRPAIVLTFEPHPRTVFMPEAPVFRLTPARLKAEILAEMGFTCVVEQAFSREFASVTAENFVRDVLVGALGVSHVVTGFDFHFGMAVRADRRSCWRRASARVSTSRWWTPSATRAVRWSLPAAYAIVSPRGDVVAAAGLMGYRYLIKAPVVEGKQLGRTLGYPTANMRLAGENRLAHGIYAVRLRRADGTLHDGVASFGRRPTTDDNGAPLLETYVFDQSPNLYGETCAVSFFGFLRPELKFDGLDALMVQMKQDEAEARALLSGVSPFSALDAKVSF